VVAGGAAPDPVRARRDARSRNRLPDDEHRAVPAGTSGRTDAVAVWATSRPIAKFPRIRYWPRRLDDGFAVMPYPRWLAQINKRVFNPGAIRKGRYPVLNHVGRVSGKKHQTPLDAFPTTSGYVLVCRYGPASDWVKNVLETGEATLRVDGDEIPLAVPRLVALEEAVAALTTDAPHKDFAKAEHFVLMDRVV
jgi:deazaflavin-dependent oxidoreductase (nitroreductase family)